MNKVNNLIIVDASGSMSTIYRQALTGMNETIDTIRLAQERNPEMEQYVTLLSFSGSEEDLQYVCQNKHVSEVNTIKEKDYQLRGMTALYDAIGKSITDLKKYVEKEDRVLVTIITDGYENDSKEWKRDRVKSLLDELRKQDWVITYIGANQDVEIEASKIGIRNTLAFCASVEGTDEMFRKERMARLRWNDTVREKIAFEEGTFFEHINDTIDPDRITPSFVNSLGRKEIFVFGSNTAGKHNGGAAYTALRKFGAHLGQGEGLQGQSYAIPTVGHGILFDKEIPAAIDRFISFAKSHPELRFLVTRIGCGNAGLNDTQMAHWFQDAKSVPNISLPQEWWSVLLSW